MRNPVEHYISKLDSSRFGFGVAKLSEVSDDVLELVPRLATAGVKLIIARINASDIAGINRLEALGFTIKDFQVTNRFDLARSLNPVALPEDFLVRDAEPGDVDHVVSVAAASFTAYGHYAADGRLDPDRCRDAYVDWARRSCEDPNVADKVIVAARDGIARGFLSFKLFEHDGRPYAAGVLGAVAPAFRGSGLFSAIVVRGLEWGRTAGLAWEEHNALATNYTVNRVFAQIGFTISNASVTLHGWL